MRIPIIIIKDESTYPYYAVPSWEEGDTGVVDGYVNTSIGIVAIVVLGKTSKFYSIPLSSIKFNDI